MCISKSRRIVDYGGPASLTEGRTKRCVDSNPYSQVELIVGHSG